MIRRLGSCTLTLVVCMLLACGGSDSPPGNSNNPPPGPGPQKPRIAVVVLENTDYANVIGNPAMPWLNQLAQANALATNYYANTHPSIGNYFMMTTGQLVTNDDSADIVVSVDNIVRQFAKDGKTWRAYADALPSPGYLGGNTGTYLKRHNPFAYFSDVVNSSAQAANIVPFPQLESDLSSGSLPDFLFIVPDAVHDAHSCPDSEPDCTLDERLALADTWLRENVAPLLSSPTFSNGLLVVTFDEASNLDSTHGGGRIVTVVAGSAARKVLESDEFYQHENLLSLIGDLLNLSSVPGAGQGANPMTDVRQ
jgi:phosphatidylinositol-3-phosphatase